MKSLILTRMTICLGILGLLLVFSSCSDATAPGNLPTPDPESHHPRGVPFVTVDHGPLPGEVEVSWWIVNWSTHPILEYRVALSYAGPITEDNWASAEILGRFPQRKGQVAYRECFGEASDLIQGAAAWIAVRALDDQGNLSRLKESHWFTLTTAWWIEGRATDLRGHPVSGISINSPLTGHATVTDPMGNYRVGPIRSIDVVDLDADDISPASSWYGMTSSFIRSRRGVEVVSNQDFVLLHRNHLDPYCQLPDNEFLTYLRDMTYTSVRSLNHGSPNLWRWDHYPLKVFIPAQVNGAGVAMGEAAAAALALWNGIMGEDYFVRTESQEEAHIEFSFPEMDNHYGLATLLEPTGPGAHLGRVIPRKMGVAINPVLPDFETVTETSLHELGHTLGLYAHAGCSAPGYLMKVAGGFGALDRAEPIHPDEQRAVESIRYLPQGQDMALYRIK